MENASGPGNELDVSDISGKLESMVAGGAGDAGGAGGVVGVFGAASELT